MIGSSRTRLRRDRHRTRLRLEPARPGITRIFLAERSPHKPTGIARVQKRFSCLRLSKSIERTLVRPCRSVLQYSQVIFKITTLILKMKSENAAAPNRTRRFRAATRPRKKVGTEDAS